jgi:hypothetical protein
MRGPTSLSVERESDGIEHSVDLLDYSTRKTVTSPIWIDGATRLQLIWTCVSVISVCPSTSTAVWRLVTTRAN